MVRSKEVRAEHVEGVTRDFNAVLFEAFAEEGPHDLARLAARLAVMVVERFRVGFLQKIVELESIRIGQADQAAHRVHAGRICVVGVSAGLAEMALNCYFA